MATLLPTRILLLLLVVNCAVQSTADVLSPTILFATTENEAAVTTAVDLYMQALEATRIQEHEQAVALYQRSIEAFPQFAGAHNNLAMLLLESTNDLPRALKSLEIGARMALATNDTMNYASIETNIGYLTWQNHSLDPTACLQAITHYDRAIAVEPTFVQALFNKATMLLDLGKLNEAEELLHQVITLEPFNDAAHFELGTLCFRREDMKKALYHEEFVIQHSKSSKLVSAAMDNKGHCLTELGRHVEAMKVHEQALEFAPDSAFSLANLVTARRTLCNWNGIEELHDRLVDRQEVDIKAGARKLSLVPYDSTLMNLPDSFRKMLAQFDSNEFEQLQTLELPKYFRDGTTLGHQRTKPLKIGYLSYDFRNHVMAQLTLGLLKHHDARAVTTYCYSYGINDGSELRKQVESKCDVFREIWGVSDLEAAQQIGLDQVDILIDLMAHTKGARLGIIALRPSPIIVNYLGYPGTMGSTFTDFAIVDRMVVPPEVAAATMTEQIVYLPHSYQANLYDPATAARARANNMESFMRTNRTLNGLPVDGIVFCNFNSINKMEPRSFAAWMTILRRVPSSVLWLLMPSSTHDNAVRAILHSEAQAHGIHPSRIIFAERVDQQEHIARLVLADIYLDSFVYNAHSTASDALWSNLPIVTLWGNEFPSRVAAALISNAMEHPGIVVHSLKDYEDAAVQLAESVDLRLRIQNGLAENALASPLFDADRTTNSVETAYQVMHDVIAYVDQEKIVNFQMVINPEASREFQVEENTALRSQKPKE